MANIRRMEIEPADNGYMCTTIHEPDKGKEMYDYSSNQEKTVHATAEDVAEHVKKKLKSHKPTKKKHSMSTMNQALAGKVR